MEFKSGRKYSSSMYIY